MSKPSSLKLLSAITCLSLALNSTIVRSQGTGPSSACKPEGTVLAFFNGVLNTDTDAANTMDHLSAIHGEKDGRGEKIRYELMYNYTEGFSDFVETFEQRMQQQNGLLAGRFELFFESLRGGGSWWSRITWRISSTAEVLAGLRDAFQASTIGTMAKMFRDPPTQINYQEHRSRLDNFIVEGKKILFVAHCKATCSPFQLSITRPPKRQ